MEDYFNNNVNFVYKLAKRIDFGYVAYEDLVQAGLMGLLYASRRYDSKYHTPFLSYASVYILNEMKRELREANIIKLNKEMIKIVREIKRTDNYNISELSLKYHITKERTILALNYLNSPLSLNKIIDDKEIIELIPNNQDDRRSVITEAINDLDEVNKQIIFYRYFKGYTQMELALKLNKTQTNISRLEKAALMKLKKIILNKYI